MAILIKILKCNEDDVTAEYIFAKDADWQNPTRTGQVLINKADGHYTIIREPEIESDSTTTRVIYKLLKHWQANEFPDETSWAS